SLTRQEPSPQPSGWGDKALPAFESLDQLRDHLSGVTDDAEVRHREDRGVRILVDRDDRPRVLHADQVLHGPGDPDGDVDVGLDGLARLADLLGVGDPARVDDGPGGSGGGIERLGETLDHLVCRRAPEETTSGNDDFGVTELRALELL